MQTREKRFVKLGVEERADGSEGLPMIRGYAAVFDQETLIGSKAWGFREKIARGAFAEAMKSSDVHALFNHDDDMVLGRLEAGTLRMFEDDHGLRVEIDPPDTQAARDLITSMQRGDIDQMSFAFTMEGGKQSLDESGDIPLRIIERVGELYDVSVVTRGAYPQTEAEVVRSLQEARKAQRHHNYFNARRRKEAERHAAMEQKFRGI